MDSISTKKNVPVFPVVDDLMENARDLIICMDVSGEVIYSNTSANKMFATLNNNLLGQKYESLLSDSFRDKFNSIKETLLFNERIDPLEKELITNKEENIVLSIQYSTIRDKAGKITGISAIHREVSEFHKVASKAQSLIETAPDAMVIVNQHGQMVLINAQTEELFGYSKSELLGKSVEKLIPKEFLNVHEKHREDFFKNPRRRGMGMGMELYGERKDGAQFPVEISLSPLITKEGTFVSAAIRDITNRKKEEKKFRGLLESAPDAMVIVGEDGCVQLVNSQLENIFGYHRDELIGKKMEILIPDRFREKHPEHRKGYFKKPKVRPMGAGLELRAMRKNGEEFPVEISLSPLETPDGILVSAAIRDISERKLAELLKIRARETEIKNEELEQFAYVASHDLQEPLTTVISFTKLLKKKYGHELNESAQKYIDFTIQATERMGNLMKGLLDYSRVGLNGERVIVDCNKLIDNIKTDLTSAIKKNKAKIVVGELPVINGYENELRMLFQNLISNAIKYNSLDKPPEIKIGATLETKNWKFFVSDNGIGIDRKYLKRIFIIFQRLHGQNEFEGTGIGLSHCKKIVEMHGGKIWADSVLGEGSTFYFTIPVVYG